VGYTNAGKSTLLNRITGAEVLAENKLFATLDPTTRRLRLPTNQNILLSDTVGFIRKLPHDLVEAFKATLEEVVQADLLLHVVDVSHPQCDEQIEAVNAVLREIGAEGKATLMVFNKIDKAEPQTVRRLLELHHPSVAISAQSGEGVPQLLDALGVEIRPVREYLELNVPHHEITKGRQRGSRHGYRRTCTRNLRHSSWNRSREAEGMVLRAAQWSTRNPLEGCAGFGERGTKLSH
jgi:GTP-binding protein HflX